MSDTKAELAADIRFALNQRARMFGVKMGARAADFLADEIVKQIELSNWIFMRGAPTPPHSTHPIVSQMERQAETAVIEGLIQEMERLWLYDDKAEETICPVKNYMPWLNLVKVIRKRLK